VKIHFIGIGGIGLSALARILKYDGHNVSGSDIKSTQITKDLQAEGIDVTTPHNHKAIKDQDLVIYSAAIKSDNVEILEALKKGIKTIPRKEALPIVLGDKKNYCVCGAHGKSTTTAILASILQSSALIGAISKEFDSNFRYINDLVAFEADESDGSFLLSNPYCAIVTNAEPEHMEYYNYDLKRFYHAYEQFLKISDLRVINAEDDFLKTLDIDAIKLYPSKDLKNISFTIKDGEPFTKFDLKDLGSFEVWGFGHHIAVDASLAILSALNEIGLDAIKENIKKYKGIKKRFDILKKEDNFVVIDDYAHHPTEIVATLKSVALYKELKNINKVTVIWQPHKYSRLKDNLEAFKNCFTECDELVILPVWNVGEKALDIDLEKEFARYNPMVVDKVISSKNNIALYKENKIVSVVSSGIVIGVGAGDITYQLRGI
jgi:UDP-N-acetylmuramate--alanine ligase